MLSLKVKAISSLEMKMVRLTHVMAVIYTMGRVVSYVMPHGVTIAEMKQSHAVAQPPESIPSTVKQQNTKL